MKIIFHLLKILISSVVLIFLHYFISYTLSSPWNYFNILFLAIILFIMIWESGLAIWLAFFLHFFIELYSVTPFGLILFSSTVSILIVYKLYVLFFTNKSWYSALALTASAIVIYRILYTILFVVLEFSREGSNIMWGALFVSYMWEIIFTSIATGITVFILSKTSSFFETRKTVLPN